MTTVAGGGPITVDAARFERAEEIFHAAADLAGDARLRFLERACGADADLRRDVSSLFDVDAAFFLDQPLVAGVPLAGGAEEAPDIPDLRLPHAIATYTLVREIGRGGMGRVYAAEQAGTGRRVAVKLLRPLASTLSLRRFRVEQRILAGLEHAGIARLYDAGTTAQGVPYLVMEYVQGVNLLAYCEAHRLSVTERLRLFEQVCHAVQYAHQHLVVHRDLKPSNILISEGGEPKLLDFGIAKLLSEGYDEEEVGATLTGLRLMTPDYASPEQVRGESVTTASDVYSLGVVLYELLTTERPYRLTTRNAYELERSVLEQTPTRPSRVAPTASAAALRGDLDNILLKALAKEPAQRYASADDLADDLERHLAGLPVRARPDTLRYRARKFVGRHRWAVASGAAVAAALIVALVITVVAVVNARRERDRSTARLADVRALANVFLFDVEQQIRDLSGATAARQLLVKTGLGYLDRLAADAGDDPSLLRELANGYDRLGDVQGALLQSNLGQSEAALASYQKASSFRRRLVQPALNPDAVALRESARGELRLSQAMFQIGRTKEAPEHSALAVELLTRAVSTAARGEAEAERAEALVTHGYLLAVTGDLSNGLNACRKAVAFYEALPPARLSEKNLGGRYAFALFRTIQLLGELPDNQGLTEALGLAPRVIEMDRRLLAAEPQSAGLRRGLARDLAKLGDLQAASGRHADAVAAFTEANRLSAEDVARDQNDRLARRAVAMTMVQEAGSLVAMRRYDEARARLEPAIDQVERLLAQDSRNVTVQFTFIEAAVLLTDVAAAGTGTRAGVATFARARAMLERSTPMLEPLASAGALTGEDARLPGRVQSALAACDEALRDYSTASSR